MGKTSVCCTSPSAASGSSDICLLISSFACTVAEFPGGNPIELVKTKFELVNQKQKR